MARDVTKIIHEVNIFGFYDTPQCYKELVKKAWQKLGKSGTPIFIKLRVGITKYYYKNIKKPSSIINFLAEDVAPEGEVMPRRIYIVFMYNCEERSIFGPVETFDMLTEAKFHFSKQLAVGSP